MPTVQPSEVPTVQPSEAPTVIPTIAPTMAPNPPTWRPTPSAGQPTASPTHAISYSFSVTQTVYGVTEVDFSGTSGSNYYNAFVDAILMTLQPLTAANIVINNVQDNDRRVRRGLQESSSNIQYTVSYTIAQTGYQDATTAYNALINDLNFAIVENNDLFNGYMYVAGTNNEAPNFVGATTTDSYQVSQAVENTGADDDVPNHIHTHQKVIVGVVVGLGGGLLCIALLYVWIFFLSGDDNSSNQQNIRYNNPDANNNVAIQMTSVDPTGNKSEV